MMRSPIKLCDNESQFTDDIPRDSNEEEENRSNQHRDRIDVHVNDDVNSSLVKSNVYVYHIALILL